VAGDGREALDILEVVGSEIAMVVTDMQMPGMDGPTLARAMRARAISVPVLFVSGFGREPEDVPGHFLQKPFMPETLLAAVRRLLGNTRDARRVL